MFLWIQVENSYDVCDCASIFVHSQNQKALNLVVGTRTYVSFIVVVVSMYSRIIYLLFIKKKKKMETISKIVRQRQRARSLLWGGVAALAWPNMQRRSLSRPRHVHQAASLVEISGVSGSVKSQSAGK